MIFERNDRLKIKRIGPSDDRSFKEAMKLAWRTFLKFEAPDYTKEGIESFREFINDRSLLRMFNAGEYILYGAYLKDELAGMISIREQTHISLLFVDEIHHRKGIGRCLINAAKEMEEDMGYDLLTVNAAPYAIGFYHRLGFVDTDIARVKEGITYTSMQLDF